MLTASSFKKCTKKASSGRGSLLLFLSICFFALVGCSQSKNNVLKLSGSAFGTTWHITVFNSEAESGSEHSSNGFNPETEKALANAIETVLVDINQSMSTYIADSELNQFNGAELNTWITASDDLRRCLQIAQDVSYKTQGAFDITVGPLVDLWGFGPEVVQPEVPEAELLSRALEKVNFRALEIKDEQIRKTSDIALDLSAVAKGYAVDRVAEVLKEQGFNNFLVEIGGELRLSGINPRNSKWRIGVESPSGVTGQTQRAIAVTNRSVATSGDYRNYFEVEGKRFSHTINPITGMPITHSLASVTVIADNTALADALATGMNVMGPEAAMALARKENIAIYLIVKTDSGFEERHSPAFSAYLQ